MTCTSCWKRKFFTTREEELEAFPEGTRYSIEDAFFLWYSKGFSHPLQTSWEWEDLCFHNASDRTGWRWNTATRTDKVLSHLVSLLQMFCQGKLPFFQAYPAAVVSPWRRNCFRRENLQSMQKTEAWNISLLLISSREMASIKTGQVTQNVPSSLKLEIHAAGNEAYYKIPDPVKLE